VHQKTSTKAKASIIEHKIRTTIANLQPTNPIYYTSLRERLDTIIKSHEEDMEYSTTLLDELNSIKDELDVEKVAQQHSMKGEEFAIYQMIRAGYVQMKAVTGSPLLKLAQSDEQNLSDVSKSIFTALDNLAVIDWKHKQDQQKKMLKEIKRALYKLGYDVTTADKESKNILHLARNIL